jgi:hypothetical protein
MTIIDTLIQEAAERRARNINQIPAIAAAAFDKFIPDGAALRACVTEIDVKPNFDSCDFRPTGIVYYTLPFGLLVSVNVSGSAIAASDVSIRQGLTVSKYTIDATREALSIALYRNMLAMTATKAG